MTTTKQRIISADSHVTEPGDLWVNYIEPAYRSRAPHIEHQSTTDIWVCDTGTMFPVGVMHGVRHKEGEVKVDGRWEEVPTSGYDPEARIPEIEMDGVGAEFLYPTVAMRFFTIEDVPFAEACLRAYNNWVMDFCKPYPDRFKACGVISLDNVENAVSEARRCKKLGLPGLMIALYPDESRPYHDPRYNPFWAVAEETGLPVSLHVATPRRVNDDVTETQMLTRNLLCPEVITGMIYAGVFDEFPGLKVVSAENDAGWAANFIERMDYFHTKARARNLSAGRRLNKRLPSEYWHNNVSYTFMRDIGAMRARDIIGVDNLMWSSDFPHGDSTWPDSQEVIAQHMVGVPEAEQRKILCENAQRMYGFS